MNFFNSSRVGRTCVIGADPSVCRYQSIDALRKNLNPDPLVRFDLLAVVISAVSWVDHHFGFQIAVCYNYSNGLIYLIDNVVGKDRNISSVASAVEESEPIRSMVPVSIPALTKPKKATTLLAV